MPCILQIPFFHGLNSQCAHLLRGFEPLKFSQIFKSIQVINLDQLSQNENEPHSFLQVSLDLISFYKDFFVCFGKQQKMSELWKKCEKLLVVLLCITVWSGNFLNFILWGFLCICYLASRIRLIIILGSSMSIYLIGD